VKQSRFHRALLFVALATTALTCSHSTGLAAILGQPSEASANFEGSPQQLSPDGQAALRAIIQAGNLPGMRWPNFSDYIPLVDSFYKSGGDSLPWINGMQPTSQAQQAIAVLMNADQEGLSAEDYEGSHWQDRLAKLKPLTPQPSETDALQFDVALTVSVMRYSSDLHIGKVNPKHFDFGFDVKAKRYDLPEFLRKDLVNSSDVAVELQQLEPPYPGYRRTLQALRNYIQLAKEYEGKPLPAAGKTIAPGDSYSALPQLGYFLQLVGDLPKDVKLAPDETVYQGALVDAVKHFQSRHGRDADGRINAQTLADLNVPLSSRVRQMQLTLERWRWIPLSYKNGAIVTNIPEFRLRAYDENFKMVLSMNVVVGKAYDHNTPVFENALEYVVFRPYWNVPYSIAKAEFLPHIARDPDYLAKKGFEVVDSRQQVVTSGAVSPEVLQQLRAGKLFVRQPPGPKNSLGLVKFIFPNDHNVYMHDTPAQEFFSKSRRDFSHGCIRLGKPEDLAVYVLRDNPAWNRDRIRAAMNGGTTQQVNLARPIPVLIVYGTVVVPENGTVHFYDDIYGHDASLEKVLDKGYPYPN
jgi:L,D-transpeptidase YcbB